MGKIKQGYRLTVRSWENDADNWKTCILDGLSHGEVSVLVVLCNALRRETLDSEEEDCVCNMYDPQQCDIDNLHVVLKEALGSRNLLPDTGYDDGEIMAHLLTVGLTGSEFYTRVCESVTVEYVPEQITLEDVTSEFV